MREAHQFSGGEWLRAVVAILVPCTDPWGLYNATGVLFECWNCTPKGGGVTGPGNVDHTRLVRNILVLGKFDKNPENGGDKKKKGMDYSM